MASLVKTIDTAIGYVDSSHSHVDPSLIYRSLEASTPLDRPLDVQERYIDRPEAYSEWEREGWKREGELMSSRRAADEPK